MSGVVITGLGAVCASGCEPAAIWDALRAGRSAVGPVRGWDATGWPHSLAAEVTALEPRALVPDRKLHKLLDRTDLLGLYAARRAIETSGVPAARPPGAADANAFDDRSAVYVGAGGAPYRGQYDFLPLLAAAGGDLEVFGRELTTLVHPMWLLRTLPNNVLCHVGIQHGFKGPNGCVTNHSVSGLLALGDALAVLRDGVADRAVVVAHDAPVEPQRVAHYGSVGLLSGDAVRPFDVARSGTVLGEGAAALVLETAGVVAARGATVLGELLGSGCVSEGEGLLSVRVDGDGVARAIRAALADAAVEPAAVGVIVAHGNGTPGSDASEARGIVAVFGAAPPPVLASKWAFGHTLAASGLLDVVVAVVTLARGEVPGIATLRARDPECAVPVSAAAQPVRGGVALVLCRGFAGMHAAVVVRGATGGAGG